MRNSYVLPQTVKDAQYTQAWKSAPKEFREQARNLGMDFLVETNSAAIEFDDNRHETAEEFDISDKLDSELDKLIERYGIQNAKVIRAVYCDLQKDRSKELEMEKALSLGRILFFLVKSESKNIKALLYAALHAIPRLAAANGMFSMRDSARKCGVSPEWIRRSRDEICNLLEIPIPEEGKKGVDARLKYSQNGKLNHWRTQTTKKEQKLCKKVIKVSKSTPPKQTKRSPSLLELLKHSASQKRES